MKGAPVNNDGATTTDAPDSQVAVYDYEEFTVTWEHRRFAMNNTEHQRYGAYFYGTEGILHIGWRDGWTFYPANKNDAKAHASHALTINATATTYLRSGWILFSPSKKSANQWPTSSPRIVPRCCRCWE